MRVLTHARLELDRLRKALDAEWCSPVFDKQAVANISQQMEALLETVRPPRKPKPQPNSGSFTQIKQP